MAYDPNFSFGMQRWEAGSGFALKVHDLTDQSAAMRSILEPCRIVSKDNVPFKARHRDSAHHAHFAIEEFNGQSVGNGSGTDITTLAIGGTAILAVVVAIGLLAFRSRKK